MKLGWRIVVFEEIGNYKLFPEYSGIMHKIFNKFPPLLTEHES